MSEAEHEMLTRSYSDTQMMEPGIKTISERDSHSPHVSQMSFLCRRYPKAHSMKEWLINFMTRMSGCLLTKFTNSINDIMMNESAVFSSSCTLFSPPKKRKKDIPHLTSHSGEEMFKTAK
jgi:hypothetical protein